MSTRYEAPRRRTHEAPVLVLLLVLLAGTAVLATDPFRFAVALTGSAARWAPADAARAYATIERSGPDGQDPQPRPDSAPAMVEQARLSPLQAVESVSASAYRTIPTSNRKPTQWWRETLFASGWDDPWRNRLRALDTTGTITRVVQTWGDRGLVFAPGLLELPADAAPGSHWNSSGDVAGNEQFGVGRYRNESTATAAGDCLRVVSDTRLTAEDGTQRQWREENTWCPGRGVVTERGSTDLGRDPLGWSLRPGDPRPANPELLHPPQVPLDRLTTWTSHPMTGIRGDDSFGFSRGQDQTLVDPRAVTRDGVVLLAAVTTPDVITLETANQPQYQLPLTRLHPGGAVLDLTTFGNTLAISTTERRVQLFHPGGYQHWSATLPDVSTAGPVPAGPGRIVVATLGGSVHCLDPATGRELWRRQLDAGVTLRPVSNGSQVAVADEQHTITVFDAASGAQRWQSEGILPVNALAISGDSLLTAAGGLLRARGLADQRFRWEAGIPTTGMHLAVTSDRVIATGTTETVLLDPADGRRVAVAEPAEQVLAAADTAFLVTGDTLTALGPDGQRRATWPLTPATDRSLQPSDSGIWVLGQDPQAQWTMDRVGP